MNKWDKNVQLILLTCILFSKVEAVAFQITLIDTIFLFISFQIKEKLLED